MRFSLYILRDTKKISELFGYPLDLGHATLTHLINIDSYYKSYCGDKTITFEAIVSEQQC